MRRIGMMQGTRDEGRETRNRTSRYSSLVSRLPSLLAVLGVVVAAGAVDAQAPARLTRGNAAGEWRFGAADAWSTRYSPLDQINARNFDSLQVSWEWNAAVDGPDEYYRTTPLYANGRLLTVATTHRYAYAI